MIVRHLYFLFSSVTLSYSLIDCSHEDTCFGEPPDCDPNTSCTTLFYFDATGNLHLYLRNFTDSNGYAAFPVNRLPEDITEYFICLPHQGKRVSGHTELGELVQISDRNLTGVVEKLDNYTFRCMFSAFELPDNFQQEQVFFVSKDTYDEIFVIFDGKQLYNLENEIDFDAYSDDEELVENVMDDIFTSDDEKIMSDVIGKLPLVTDKKEDIEFEDTERRIHSRSVRKNFVNGEYVDLSEEEKLEYNENEYSDSENVEDESEEEVVTVQRFRRIPRQQERMIEINGEADHKIKIESYKKNNDSKNIEGNANIPWIYTFVLLLLLL